MALTLTSAAKLANPNFGNIEQLGQDIGSLSARRRQRGMLTDLLGPALDPMATPEQLRQSAMGALDIGQQDLALQLGGMASQAVEAEKLKTARKNLERAAIAKAGENTEVASALTGADIPTLREYLMGQSEPYTLSPGETRFRGSTVIARGAEPAPDIGTAISEWINPENPNEVVYQTVQSKTGQTLQLGSNIPLTAEQLDGLQKKSKPSTSISVSTAQKADEAYAVAGATGLAKQDLDFIARGETALATLDNIAEARLIFSKVDAKDVLGFAAKEANTVKRAFLGLAGALGVSEDSGFYQNLAAQTTAADLVTTFTQDFVRPRMEATKGSITEREFETFMASVPNLLQTEGGYKAVLGMMEKAATAHILRSNYLQQNMQSGAKAQAARDKWSEFSRQFPKPNISNTAMRDLWSDFKQDGFDRSKTVFEFDRPDGQGRTRMTFKDIRDLAGENKLHPMVQLRKLFDGRNAAYVPSSAI